MTFKNKVAVVTGGANGIGFACRRDGTVLFNESFQQTLCARCGYNKYLIVTG